MSVGLILKKVWQSRWTPVVVVVALIGGVYLARKVAPKETFELDADMLVRGNPNLHEVCLTFDDGPHPGSMDSILDTLRAKDVKATFFVVGKEVDLHPGLVRRMLAEGNEVGNHTYSHKRLNTMPIASAKQEILACAASVKRASGASMDLLRPPGMEYDKEVLQLNRSLGYVTVHWNVVAADYLDIPPSLIVKRVLDQVKDGSVILLHDAPATAKALPTIIDSLKARGYTFDTTTQMLARLPRPVYVASNAYSVKPPAPPVTETAKTKPVPKAPKVATTKPVPPAPGIRSTNRPAVDAPAWDGKSKGHTEHHEKTTLGLICPRPHEDSGELLTLKAASSGGVSR